MKVDVLLSRDADEILGLGSVYCEALLTQDSLACKKGRSSVRVVVRVGRSCKGRREAEVMSERRACDLRNAEPENEPM